MLQNLLKIVLISALFVAPALTYAQSGGPVPVKPATGANFAQETGGNLASQTSVLGATGDAAASAGGTGSISAKLRNLTDLVNQILTELGQKTEPANTQIVGDGSGPLTVDGTVTSNIGTTNGLALDATLTGGTQKAINRGGAKGSTSAADVTSTASGSNHQPLDVVIYDTSGNAITSFGGSGGTSSSFGSSFPTPGTAAGFTDGTNMVPARVVTSAPGTSDAGLVVRPISPIVGATGSATPSNAATIGGTDGTNLRALKTDSGGELQVDVLTLPSNASTNTAQVNGATTQVASNGLNTTGAGLQANALVGQCDDTSPTSLTENQFGHARINCTTHEQLVSATQSGNWSVRNQDGSGNNLTSASRGSERALSVQIVDGSGVQVTTFGGSGGTSSNFGSAVPSAGTAIGVSDGTNMVAPRSVDGDSGAGTVNVLGVNLLKRASGGPVEAGTSSDPLRVDPTGSTTQPVSGTVTANAGTGTFNIQSNASVNLAQIGGSSVQAASNGLNTTGTGLGTQALTGQCDDTSPTALTENSFGHARVNCTTHHLLAEVGAALPTGTNTIGNVGILPVTSGGTTPCYITSAASTNATNCKASAGQIYGYDLVNTTTTIYYLRLYNLSSAPTCSSATGFIRTIPIPPAGAAGQAGGIVRSLAVGQAFGTGIGFCLTGGGSSTDNTNAATGVYVSIDYK